MSAEKSGYGEPPPPYNEDEETYDDGDDDGEVPNYLNDAPPDYDTLIATPDIDSVPKPAKYNPPILEGLPENETFPHQKGNSRPASPELQIPQLAYADFLPRLTKTANENNGTPEYEDFKTLMTIVNDWLAKNPLFRASRVECIERKVGKDGVLETETTIHHCSAYGYTNYVRGIRIWLLANTQHLPIQQLWYVNVVPKGDLQMAINMFHAHRRRGRMRGQQVLLGTGFGPAAIINMGMMPSMPMFGCYGVPIFYPSFEDLDTVLEKINKKFRERPLPGRILNIETLEIKHEHMWTPNCIDPDKCYWNMKGSTQALHLNILKIFYVVGSPIQQEIAINDFQPACISPETTSALGKPRFENFENVIEKASNWITGHQEISVSNIQSLDKKCQLGFTMGMQSHKLDTKSMDYSKGSECFFVRILRVISVKPPQYKNSQLSSKLFVPVRTGFRTCETTSMTVARANHWLNAVRGVRVVGADTLKYEFVVERMCETKTSTSTYSTHGFQGQYWISVIRLYLDGKYEEPPPEVYCPPPAIMTNTTDSTDCCTIL